MFTALLNFLNPQEHTEITLHDDGMRITAHGFIDTGRKYPFVCQENPAVIANSVAERRYRKTISEHNFRKWS